MNVRARVASGFTGTPTTIEVQGLGLFCAVLVLGLGALVLFKAWLAASYLPGLPIDGTFQLANALERLHRGQLPGRDFLLFHGVGVVAIHYPVYVLLGANAFASEIARQLLSPLVTTWVVILIARKLTASSPMAMLTGLVYLAATLLGDSGLFTSLLAPQPGNSLIALRWAYPAACALFLVSALKPTTPWWRVSLAGALLGLAPWWSYEQGTYAVAAGCLTFVCIVMTRERKDVGVTSLFLLACLGSCFAAFALSSGGHPGELLHYVFGDIPANQGWYFGAPPNKSIATSGFTSPAVLLYAALVALLMFANTSPARRWLQLRAGSASMVAYFTWYALLAGASLAGYLQLAYCTPSANAAFLLLSCAVYRLASQNGAWRRGMVALSLCFVAVAGVASWSSVLAAHAQVRGSGESRELVSGMHLVGRFAKLPSLIDVVASAPDHRVFSTYRGLLEYSQEQPPQGRADYIIHALRGAEWQHWMATFEAGRFPFAHTIKPEFFSYEEWLQAAHWEFYARLVEDYAVVGQSDYGLLWRRRAVAVPLQRSACRALSTTRDGRFALTRRAGESFYELTARYSVQNSLQVIPVLGSLPRYLVEHTGLSNRLPFSLDPNTDAARWLAAPAAPAAYLQPQSYAPLGATRLTVTAITACAIGIPDDVLPAFSHLTQKALSP